MVQTKTYMLTIKIMANGAKSLGNTKEELIEFLQANGEHNFVEGVVEGIDIEFRYDSSDEMLYSDLGGEGTPIVLYGYDKLHLVDIADKVTRTFGHAVECELAWLATETWQEGWKESFKPFQTRRFNIFPPWEATSQKSNCKLLPLEIEPGMAFGTGGHATTKLCLGEIERIAQEFNEQESNLIKQKSLLDIGTGSGILAIGACKLGFNPVYATDIDDDSLTAASQNAKNNGVTIKVEKGTLPREAMGFDIVVANILAHVLIKLMTQLTAPLKQGGQLILSGILWNERNEIIDICKKNALKMRYSRQLEEWALLSFGFN